MSAFIILGIGYFRYFEWAGFRRALNLDKYVCYILKHLGERDLLEGLAEECAELSQAALKLIRASGQGNLNRTPITEEQARENLHEEAVDVFIMLSLLIHKDDIVKNAEYSPKWKRWAERLGYKESKR